MLRRSTIASAAHSVATAESRTRLRPHPSGLPPQVRPLFEKMEKKKRLVAKALQQARTLVGEEHDEDNFFVGAFDAMAEKLKILISNFQILVQMPGVLKFKFPPGFSYFLSRIRFLSFDVMSAFSFDCLIGRVGLYTKFVATMALPPMLGVLIWLKKCQELRSRRKRLQRAQSAIAPDVPKDTIILVAFKKACRRKDGTLGARGTKRLMKKMGV